MCQARPAIRADSVADALIGIETCLDIDVLEPHLLLLIQYLCCITGVHLESPFLAYFTGSLENPACPFLEIDRIS